MSRSTKVVGPTTAEKIEKDSSRTSFSVNTADLRQHRQKPTVFSLTIYRTTANKNLGLSRPKDVTADGRNKHGLNVKSFTAGQKVRGN